MITTLTPKDFTTRKNYDCNKCWFYNNRNYKCLQPQYRDLFKGCIDLFGSCVKGNIVYVPKFNNN